jgi:hypothetical protein
VKGDETILSLKCKAAWHNFNSNLAILSIVVFSSTLEAKAYDKFQDAFYLYSLFWSLNLKLVRSGKLVENHRREGWKAKDYGYG